MKKLNEIQPSQWNSNIWWDAGRWSDKREKRIGGGGGGGCKGERSRFDSLEHKAIDLHAKENCFKGNKWISIIYQCRWSSWKKTPSMIARTARGERSPGAHHGQLVNYIHWFNNRWISDKYWYQLPITLLRKYVAGHRFDGNFEDFHAVAMLPPPFTIDSIDWVCHGPLSGFLDAPADSCCRFSWLDLWFYDFQGSNWDSFGDAWGFFTLINGLN